MHKVNKLVSSSSKQILACYYLARVDWDMRSLASNEVH